MRNMQSFIAPNGLILDCLYALIYFMQSQELESVSNRERLIYYYPTSSHNMELIEKMIYKFLKTSLEKFNTTYSRNNLHLTNLFNLWLRYILPWNVSPQNIHL